MINKVLFVGPDLHEVGGVSFYCSAILANYPGKSEYFSFPLNMRRNPLIFLTVLLSFAKTLLKNQVATIHINTSLNTNAILRDSFFLILSLLFKRKTVVFIHGWEDSFASSLVGFKQFLFRSLFDNVNVLIVLAEQFEQILRRKGFVTKILVETTCYPPDLHRIAHSPRSLLWSTGTGPNILFLSRIVKEKGLFELYDACSQLRKEFPSLSLCVAGDGPDLVAFRNYEEARGENFVVYSGIVTGEKKNDLFEASHIFCLPTYYGEGLPVTILEAFYFGLPVITTRAGGIAGIFADGANGFFVEPGDVASLVEKIGTVLRDHEVFDAMANYNVVYARQFSPEIVASKLALLHSGLA